MKEYLCWTWTSAFCSSSISAWLGLVGSVSYVEERPRSKLVVETRFGPN